ncbi:MAG: aldehyde dehydrogenase family protein [Anaerolineae bacterium]
MTLEPAEIQKIVAQVVAQVREKHGLAPPPPGTEQGLGLYATVDEAVRAARAAFQRLDALPLARREEIVRQMRQAAREAAQVLAYEAWTETGMGRYEDKIQKNLLVADKTPGTAIIRPQVFTGDHGLTLVEHAPYGVIASITPSTNPTSTVLNNAISMVAAGNAVVFNVHPLAKRVSAHTVALLNEAMMRAGGPRDLLTCVVEPTIESAKELMRHPGVDLLVVTGGEAVVHEAMHSGKKAICAGPGNPPVVVDETADIAQAARDIIRGASFDNNIICVDEKEVFVVASVADALKAAMKACGAVELNSWQLNRLLRAIFTENRGSGQQSVFNKRFVGQNAGALLKEIGINAGDEVRLIITEVDDPRHPLVWTEQLMPILPIVRVHNAQQGIDLAIEAEHGFRHTASMFSRNIEHLSRMARAFQGSIFVKNGANIAGLGAEGEGFTSFTIASPTGEGLTTALTFTRARRCVLKDSFRII